MPTPSEPRRRRPAGGAAPAAPAAAAARGLRLPELNRVLLSGRLTRDPDKRYAADGTPVTSFSLAFHRRFRTRGGAAAEHTGYVTVMTYQRLAEVCGQYLHAGSAVVVEGRLQMREWKGARDERRQSLELRADSVHFLDRPPAGAQAAPAAGAAGDPT
jgi:single-strand DNA-binding protein